MIILSKILFSEIERHGEEAYPHECCGALFGMIDEQKNKKTVEIKRVENAWDDAEQKHRRFRITPKDYLDLEKYARKINETLLGFYHTHPDHHAQPSALDLKYAFPFFSYMILSVRKKKASQLNSFLLVEEKSTTGDKLLGTKEPPKSRFHFVQENLKII